MKFKLRIYSKSILVEAELTPREMTALEVVGEASLKDANGKEIYKVGKANNTSIAEFAATFEGETSMVEVIPNTPDAVTQATRRLGSYQGKINDALKVAIKKADVIESNAAEIEISVAGTDEQPEPVETTESVAEGK